MIGSVVVAVSVQFFSEVCLSPQFASANGSTRECDDACLMTPSVLGRLLIGDDTPMMTRLVLGRLLIGDDTPMKSHRN
jgi:hypothetical protein